MVEDVVFGCVVRGRRAGRERRAERAADRGLPVHRPGDDRRPPVRLGQQALHFAANLIQAGTCDITIGGGVESMSPRPDGREHHAGPGLPVPAGADGQVRRSPRRASPPTRSPRSGASPARRSTSSRSSRYEKARRARDEGRFDREIVPIDVKLEGVAGTISKDEGIRDTSLEKLATLQPSFGENGVHHAGNSSQITDGASAVLLMSREKADELGLKPRARIIGQAVVGSDPVLMLTGPITATPKVLKKAGLEMKDIDLFEINEAFASVVLAWKRELNPDMSQGQRQRRRDRARAPARRDGRAPDDDAAPRARAHRRPLRPRGDVLRRRPRHGDDHRAARLAHTTEMKTAPMRSGPSSALRARLRSAGGAAVGPGTTEHRRGREHELRNIRDVDCVGEAVGSRLQVPALVVSCVAR